MAHKLTREKINQIEDNLTITGYLNEISYYLKEIKNTRTELGDLDHMKDEETHLKAMRQILYSYRKKNASVLKTREQQLDNFGHVIDENYSAFYSNGRGRGGKGLGKNSDARAYKKRFLYKIRGNIFIDDE